MMQQLTKDTNLPVELNQDVFDYPYNEGLIHQAVTKLLSGERGIGGVPTVAQKNRSDVRGGGKKPWKQKGTGRARAGSIRSPLWRGGGVTFAAKFRDYSQKLNKKMYVRAMRSILSELVRLNRLTVLEKFECDEISTKAFINKMKLLDVTNALIVSTEVTENEYYSSRNLSDFDICDPLDLNPYILLKYQQIIVTSEAIKVIEELFQ
jgi:large subunit ribosomal protein L4